MNAAAQRPVAEILADVRAGERLSPADGLRLFAAEGDDLSALLVAADDARRERVGDIVTFVHVRNINFTNVCTAGCRFCGFSRSEGDPEAECLSIEQVVRRAAEAWERGATEVCIQGGIDPRLDGRFYLDLVAAIKARVPRIHIHGFSPFEVKNGAVRAGMKVRDYLRALKDHGLDSLPGTAAEIFSEDVRGRLAPAKIDAREWFAIVRAAHGEGLPSTCTMMYGHIDRPEHWVDHMERLRALQDETRGFTEFVPLGFVPWRAPIYRDGEARAGATREEHLKVHAVARLFFRGAIENIQVSWPKLGPDFALEILRSGANDFGGTLMGENITRAAGGTHGEEMTPEEFRRLIRSIGRVPRQRDTLYRPVAEG